ncbi:T9SS type A sorting domain-containing protein [Flavihumibacter sp. UBA7668]|uniref:T9SS type A sorting domain-containing protein n=1 Tax=Flavihumibacter sp. UBA7668 TaxID=1946542 RepID=UPI0025BEFD09|nr:T9SS type A sorting domain-containing protein [Flavihumibacter sp. UBA7668]
MRRLVHVSILLLFISTGAFAQAKFWVAPGASGNWSNPANWSNSTGGSGGAGAPVAGQSAQFDGVSDANCILDIPDITIRSLNVGAGYSGTISPGGTNSLTIQASALINGGTITLPAISSIGVYFIQNGGTFTTGSTSTLFTDAVTFNGGTFNGSGNMTFLRNITTTTPAHNFLAGTSTAIFGGPNNAAINNNGAGAGTITFYNLEVNKTTPASNNLNVGVGDQVIISNNLILTSGLFRAASASIQVGAGLTVAQTSLGIIANFEFVGASNGIININAPLTQQSGSTIAINKSNAASTLTFVTDLPGNLINLNSVANSTMNLNSGTLDFPDGDNVNWDYTNFNIGTGGSIIGSAGTMTFNGNFSNSGSFAGNNGTVVFQSNVQRNYSVSSPAINGSTSFYNLVLDNTSPSGFMNIEFGDRLIATNDLTITNGSFISIGGSLSNPSFLEVGGNLSFAPGALPLSSAIQLEFSGANAQSVNLSAGQSGHINGNISFVKSAPGPVTLNSPVVLDVAGQIVTFTGGILQTTPTNILNFAVNGVIALGGNSGSYVEGPVLRTGNNAFTFPTGNGGFYGPIHISGGGFNANITNATYRAQYFHVNPDGSFPIDQQSPTNPPDLKISEAEYWVLDQTSATPVPGPRVWLSFESVRSGGITDPTTIGVAAWTNPGFWQLVGNGGLQNVGGVNYVSSANTNNITVTQGSPVFTLSTIDEVANPLPVTWLSFTGRYVNGSVELNWSTSLEVNNEEYTIERSADGHGFSTIGAVDGVGNTTNISRYNFKDTNPLTGSAYYRIKQTDRDGKFSYSEIIRISNGDVALKGLRIFPNPISGNLPLTIENGNWTNKKVTVTIYNAIGGIVRQEQITFGSDSRAKINVEALQKGSYFITTSINSERQTLQFFIQ